MRGVDGQARTTRGDENVVETESILSTDVDEKRIPEDFFYDYEDHVSKPQVDEKSPLPSTLLSLSYPFFTEVFVWAIAVVKSSPGSI